MNVQPFFPFFRYASDDGDLGVLHAMGDLLVQTIQKTFHVSVDVARKLNEELIQCVKRKNLVRIKETPPRGDLLPV